MAETLQITVTVNGEEVAREVAVRRTLADFLRHDLRLTGTHLGCEHGVCGACTVLVEGRSARSCLMLAVQADGLSVTTVEGLSQDGNLDPLQQARSEEHTSELQSLMRTSYAVFCLTKTKTTHTYSYEE